eukprot:TRINITY_DN42728_c0_g2_i1.p1 TRINITY_DN42728_c0_g2~~TRINITY_DN42728_c0_g2_i1.p1  ORF type:complete len:116 (-),score=17.08 TRINITY_DN42728_c0_g2_i1:133-480(-)
MLFCLSGVMEYEAHRVASFAGASEKELQGRSPVKMAAAGFFFQHRSPAGCVRCFHCRELYPDHHRVDCDWRALNIRFTSLPPVPMDPALLNVHVRPAPPGDRPLHGAPGSRGGSH